MMIDDALHVMMIDDALHVMMIDDALHVMSCDIRDLYLHDGCHGSLHGCYVSYP